MTARLFSSAATVAVLSCALLTGTRLGLAAASGDFVPSNPPEMVRLTNSHSPVHLAARKFLRGVNLGNYLEAPPGQNWGVTVTAAEFATMRAEGFDHVRVPVGWH